MLLNKIYPFVLPFGYCKILIVLLGRGSIYKISNMYTSDGPKMYVVILLDMDDIVSIMY